MHLHGVGQADWRNQEAKNQVTLIIKITCLLLLQSLLVVVCLFSCFLLSLDNFIFFASYTALLYSCLIFSLSYVKFSLFLIFFRWIAFCQKSHPQQLKAEMSRFKERVSAANQKGKRKGEDSEEEEKETKDY